MGEPEKASDWMVKAAEGILAQDKFLLQQIFTKDELQSGQRLQVLYFLKIVELFQQFGYHDFVIELAKTAIDVCDVDDPNRVSKISLNYWRDQIHDFLFRARYATFCSPTISSWAIIARRTTP